MKIQHGYIERDITVKVKTDGGVNTSFTQVYDCIGLLSVLIKLPRSRCLLDLIFETMDRDNMFKSDNGLADGFNARLLHMGQESINRATFQRTIKDLVSAFVIIPAKNRGSYTVNPFIAWKGQPRARKPLLKKYESFNPLELNQ